MNNISKYIGPGNVVWANRTIFYDQPGKIITDQVNMFLVLKKDNTSFYGCKIERNPNGGTNNVLRKKFYPLKYDSRAASDIYKIDYDSIVSPQTFKVTEGTLANIKRNIYKRIILGYNQGPIEYQQDFVKDYINENQPAVDNIIVYPSSTKEYNYYYIYDIDEEYYSVIKLYKKDINHFSVYNNCEIRIPRNIPYFDYYVNHSVKREDINNYICHVKTKIKTMF